MNDTSTRPWLEEGYALFGAEGPIALKVERMAKAVKISKSSFYHHFADIPSFEEELLRFHYRNAESLVERVRTCKAIVPDFFELMVEQKRLVYFNRQLLVHKRPPYQASFNQVNGLMQANFLEIWAELLNLSDQQELANSILNTVVQLFYQRLPPDDLTYPWLIEFLDEVMTFLSDVMKARGLAMPTQINR